MENLYKMPFFYVFLCRCFVGDHRHGPGTADLYIEHMVPRQNINQAVGGGG